MFFPSHKVLSIQTANKYSAFVCVQSARFKNNDLSKNSHKLQNLTANNRSRIQPDDLSLNAAIYIKQSECASTSKHIPPRYQRIIQCCKHFWMTNFPDWSHTLKRKLDKDPHFLEDFINEPHFPHNFSAQLTKIFHFNLKIAGFLDASIASGEVSNFLRFCNSIYKESRTTKGFQRGYIIESSLVYEKLADYYAKCADWSGYVKLLERIRRDGLLPSKNTYFYGIECLGKLINKGGSQLSLSSYSHSFPKSMNPKSSIPMDEIGQQIKSLIDAAEEEGHDLTQSLLDLSLEDGSLKNILTALLHNRPNLNPNLSYFIHYSSSDFSSLTKRNKEISYPAQKHLDSVKHERQNPYAGTFTSSDDISKAFKNQLYLEQMLEVPISPVLSPFGQSETTSLPPELKISLHNALVKEQSHWRKTLLIAFNEQLKRLKLTHARGKLTAYPFLKILPASNYVDLMITGIDMLIVDSALQYTSSSFACLQLGRRVERACTVYRQEKSGYFKQLERIYMTYATLFNEHEMKLLNFRHMWLYSLQSHIDQGPNTNHSWTSWPPSILFMIGEVLYNLIYEHLRFDLNGPLKVRHEFLKHDNTISNNIRRQDTPAIFEVLTEFPTEVTNEIKVHPTLINWYRDAGYPPLSFHPCALPMLCPPIPWINLMDAGYLISRNYSTRLIRSSSISSTNPIYSDDLDFDYKQIPSVLDALNCLASCPWKINNSILDYLIHVARSGGNENLSIPEWRSKPKRVELKTDMTRKERQLAYKKYFEDRQDYGEFCSLWSTELYRLSIANQYRDKTIWFPHSMDFRGRVYPCPPHFNHTGSDVARSLIVFAKGLPLGSNGFDWLKIHLVNLTGLKKRSTHSERLEYANSIMNDIIDSAEKPFDGRRWWQDQAEPWQILACCIEIKNALLHPSGPESYVSHFPVHQDGSCNGLQHYAALGRDLRGAKSVNLTDMDRPQDLYSDVVEIVEDQRRIDADGGNTIAKALDGYVRRKVIKQSIMTTVYGVTPYGATEQIRRQLRDLPDFPKDSLLPASRYLARLTLNSIGKVFTSSVDIQNWLCEIAKYISGDLHCRVSWQTPLGLPVIQPYMESNKSYMSDPDDYAVNVYGQPNHNINQAQLDLLKNYKQNVNSISLPKSSKQTSAFPPNFIHSLDSCHMILTGLQCLKEGIVFASVHDCFWTHAATVDKLNRICREEFIALHSQPILGDFADYVKNKFAYTEKEINEFKNPKKREQALALNRLLSSLPKKVYLFISWQYSNDIF
ncbi:DNA-directed RNA polymerase, mitochondrial [Schistosoma japonicum]|nr:DNA-directed RNA polymerase, mitochondrial [Schistosoma japonicum]